ncbi:sulfite exporter TauE/SafE family protein [Microbacterium sp. 179-I 3D4 NHS]|uniref:sulfite exporter TauE/SafE family protein n=1 Tax=Microbacterium sp. 179-I 3D4 NHS TaxID=3142381 RepID=UPI00399F20D5
MLDILLVVAAGVCAGAVNTAVGSGSLITYPALLLAGLPPVVANVTNTIGLTPGSVMGAVAFRKELRAHRRILAVLLPVAIAGGVIGAALLRILPSDVFRFAVPVLVIGAAVLVGVQPLLRRRASSPESPRWAALVAAVAAASIYGGYFSAAQGILLLGILGVLLGGELVVQNALKNALQAVVNLVAAVFFLLTSPFHAGFVLCVAAGALAGAPLGAWLSRRIPERAFRMSVVVFGIAVGLILALQAAGVL